MFRYLVVSLLVFVALLPIPATAQGTGGCADPPLFERMPNFNLYSCRVVELDVVDFALPGINRYESVEGKVYSASYSLMERAPIPSSLQVIRNFQNAAKSAGGTVLGEYADPFSSSLTENMQKYMVDSPGGLSFERYTNLKIVKGGTEYWINIAASIEEYRDYNIVIVERPSTSLDTRTPSSSSGQILPLATQVNPIAENSKPIQSVIQDPIKKSTVQNLSQISNVEPLIPAAKDTPGGSNPQAQSQPIDPQTILVPPKMTSMTPTQHGFRFSNTFVNDFVPELSIRTGGLCGGMSYAALDYYFSNIPIPEQNYRPANGTVLQKYLYDRQVNAIMASIDRWAEFGFNPNGVRNSEFFRWGLEGKPGGRIAELRSFIDQGKPAVLGLQGTADGGNHYVIAIGYDMGRYQGDLGAYQQDFKIFIIDPIYPNETKTLTPDLSAQVWSIPGHLNSDGTRSIDTYQSYFVDRNYAIAAPPLIPNRAWPNDDKIYELLLTFETGNDDLRGGNDNVDVTINLFDGTKQYYPNINLGKRWVPNYTETESVLLTNPVPPSLIMSLVIAPTLGGGISGDNWDMKRFRVCALGGGLKIDPLVETFFYRFTGETKQLVVSVNNIPPTPSGFMGQLELNFITGDDDLRGGNDNVNVIVTFINGANLTFNNVNKSSRWVDRTSQTVRLLIPINPPALLKSITISTTFGGGIAGDNWDMRFFKAVAQGTGLNKEVARYGEKRFTGSDKSLTVKCTP